TPQHCARVNGWIVIALTDTVAALPAGDANRAHYISLLQAMFAKLKATQQSGGYLNRGVEWHLVLHVRQGPRDPEGLSGQGGLPAGRAEGVGLAAQHRAALQRRR